MQRSLKWNTNVLSPVKKESNYKRIFHLRACKKANIPQDVCQTIYTTKIRAISGVRGTYLGWPNTISKKRSTEGPAQMSIVDVVGVPRDSIEQL